MVKERQAMWMVIRSSVERSASCELDLIQEWLRCHVAGLSLTPLRQLLTSVDHVQSRQPSASLSDPACRSAYPPHTLNSVIQN